MQVLRGPERRAEPHYAVPFSPFARESQSGRAHSRI